MSQLSVWVLVIYINSDIVIEITIISIYVNFRQVFAYTFNIKPFMKSVEFKYGTWLKLEFMI